MITLVGKRLWVKYGPAETVVLLACRANKGEPHADQPRGLQALAFKLLQVVC